MPARAMAEPAATFFTIPSQPMPKVLILRCVRILFGHCDQYHFDEDLVEYDYLKRPHQVRPLLAEAMPDVSKDGLVYTFKIKSGIKFSDHAAFTGGKGREVKAQDFVYSFMRLADPKLNSEGFWLVDGHIKGLNEWREKQKSAAKVDYDAPVEGFKALDDRTFQISLTSKYPQLMFVLAMANTVVVAREVVEKLGADFANTPVGTGPYKLAEWMRNSKITFDRNPNWHGQAYPSEGETGDEAKGLLSDANKPRFCRQSRLSAFTETQPMWLNFMSGRMDFTAIPKDNFKSAVDEKTKELLPELANKGVKLEKFAEPDVTYMAFNLEDPVIKKGGPNLRKAIALALDKVRSIEVFRNGRGILAQSPIPPGLAGYDEKFVNPFSSYDVAKAKEYLAKAGYPGGKGLPEMVLP